MSQNVTRTQDARQFKPIKCRECDHLPVVVGGKVPNSTVGVYLTCGCEDIGLMDLDAAIPRKEWPARWVLPDPERELTNWNLKEDFRDE